MFRSTDERQQLHEFFVLMTFVLLEHNMKTPEATDMHDDFLAVGERQVSQVLRQIRHAQERRTLIHGQPS